MVPVSVLTLIMSPVPSPSILVLQPTAEQPRRAHLGGRFRGHDAGYSP